MSQNGWKTAFTLFVIFQITQAWELVCYNNGSLSNFKRVKYTNAAELITSGYYDINQKGVVYAHGYRGSLTTEGTPEITDAILKQFGTNICAVDWSKEANSGLIPFANFPIVIAAAYVVQRELAEALKIMWQNGMNPKTMHLMGLSLGAHVVGNAGRTFHKLTNESIARYAPEAALTRAIIRNTGNHFVDLVVASATVEPEVLGLVPRATGLDPAKPGYDGTFSLNERIDKTSADFVDIIHTDTSRYGMATAVGHVDCYPNLIEYKKTGVQPGCDRVNIILHPPLTPKDACSHRRSLDLYIDSLEHECQLLAAQAASEKVWASPGFVPEVVACIGEEINQTLRGNFYLVTNGQSPYGLNEAGIRAS